MSHPWADDAFFYHIYPLGLCGAPARNDFHSAPTNRLDNLYGWLDSIQELGANALYLGPLFESTAHGYDTADYFWVDRRLGSNQTLAAFSREVHRRGMRLVLDGVFNHTGRDFWAFRDLQANRESSPYRDWYQNVDFSRRSPKGDPFSYEGWSGHFDLVKLNLANPDARGHLFLAVQTWVEQFEIDGLRLDAGDQLAPDFLRDLAVHCRGLRSDFWLMGEMVFGDYRRLANPEMLDSVTNYEGYKALYSSLVDGNYHEMAYSLRRVFGPEGMFPGGGLYNFADNHDVNRVASNLKNPAHLFPLYLLLFAMPGIPSVYYGSEWGLTGQRTKWSDAALRPQLDISQSHAFPRPDLRGAIRRLAAARRDLPALRHGSYRELAVAPQQLAFQRAVDDQQVVVALNSSSAPASVEVRLERESGVLVDRLNPGDRFPIENHRARIDPIPPTWGRILEIQS